MCLILCAFIHHFFPGNEQCSLLVPADQNLSLEQLSEKYKNVKIVEAPVITAVSLLDELFRHNKVVKKSAVNGEKVCF